MPRKRVLFISWQGCLGHVTRDVAIAREIHEQLPEVDLVWLASPLATEVLRESGERLLPESTQSADYNSVFGRVTDEYGFNVMKYMYHGMKLWNRNVELFRSVAREHPFDLVIGDEIYELQFAIAEGRLQPPCKLVMIHDFLGAVTMTRNPLERLIWYSVHRKVVRTLPHPDIRHVFLGEYEDVLDRRGGPFLPNWRDVARKHMEFLGYAIRFGPADYADRAALRQKLGYGPGPLVVCALGGASVGAALLELCGRAYPVMKEQVPDLRMVAIGGALFDPGSAGLPNGVDVRGYVPDLHEHYAASDLAIIVGGGTSATELTALKRPFIYFPLEKQYDQRIYIPRRLERHRAGVQMEFASTTPEDLAAAALENLGRDVDYADIPLDAPRRATKLVGEILSSTT